MSREVSFKGSMGNLSVFDQQQVQEQQQGHLNKQQTPQQQPQLQAPQTLYAYIAKLDSRTIGNMRGGGSSSSTSSALPQFWEPTAASFPTTSLTDFLVQFLKPEPHDERAQDTICINCSIRFPIPTKRKHHGQSGISTVNSTSTTLAEEGSPLAKIKEKIAGSLNTTADGGAAKGKEANSRGHHRLPFRVLFLGTTSLSPYSFAAEGDEVSSDSPATALRHGPSSPNINAQRICDGDLDEGGNDGTAGLISGLSLNSNSASYSRGPPHVTTTPPMHENKGKGEQQQHTQQPSSKAMSPKNSLEQGRKRLSGSASSRWSPPMGSHRDPSSNEEPSWSSSFCVFRGSSCPYCSPDNNKVIHTEGNDPRGGSRVSKIATFFDGVGSSGERSHLSDSSALLNQNDHFNLVDASLQLKVLNEFRWELKLDGYNAPCILPQMELHKIAVQLPQSLKAFREKHRSQQNKLETSAQQQQQQQHSELGWKFEETTSISSQVQKEPEKSPPGTMLEGSPRSPGLQVLFSSIAPSSVLAYHELFFVPGLLSKVERVSSLIESRILVWLQHQHNYISCADSWPPISPLAHDSGVLDPVDVLRVAARFFFLIFFGSLMSQHTGNSDMGRQENSKRPVESLHFTFTPTVSELRRILQVFLARFYRLMIRGFPKTSNNNNNNDDTVINAGDPQKGMRVFGVAELQAIGLETVLQKSCSCRFVAVEAQDVYRIVHDLLNIFSDTLIVGRLRV